MMRSPTVLAMVACALAAVPALAQDRADIDPTVILGNRELPKVLYIVPWKKPVPGGFTGRPMVSVVDEALAPIDRDVFKRQVQYLAQQQARQPAPSPTQTPTQTPTQAPAPQPPPTANPAAAPGAASSP